MKGAGACAVAQKQCTQVVRNIMQEPCCSTCSITSETKHNQQKHSREGGLTLGARSASSQSPLHRQRMPSLILSLFAEGFVLHVYKDFERFSTFDFNIIP